MRHPASRPLCGTSPLREATAMHEIIGRAQISHDDGEELCVAQLQEQQSAGRSTSPRAHSLWKCVYICFYSTVEVVEVGYEEKVTCALRPADSWLQQPEKTRRGFNKSQLRGNIKCILSVSFFCLFGDQSYKSWTWDGNKINRCVIFLLIRNSGQFTQKSKVHFYPARSFCCELLSFGNIACRDVCPRSNMMELDETSLVALKALK